jgi:cell division protein FtsB
MTKQRFIKELFVMAIICFATFHALKSIYGSVQRQIFLQRQIQSLKTGRKQAVEINKDLQGGLNSYNSKEGLERLARERLNLAGKDEVLIRIGK